MVEKPLLRLRLLTQRSFGFGTISAVFVGFALFGSVYLLPAYLGQVQRYNAEQIGQVLAWTGLPQLILIPLVPKLMQRFDARFIAFTGMLAVRGVILHEHRRCRSTTPATSSSSPNIVRAGRPGHHAGATVAPVSLGSVAPQDAPAASGISNMMRNLGGAIGTAAARHHRHQARAVPLQHHRRSPSTSAARRCGPGSPR